MVGKLFFVHFTLLAGHLKKIAQNANSSYMQVFFHNLRLRIRSVTDILVLILANELKTPQKSVMPDHKHAYVFSHLHTPTGCINIIIIIILFYLYH